MVQEIRSLQKLANFFRVSRWGRRGGGGLYAVLYGIRKDIRAFIYYQITGIASLEGTITDRNDSDCP